MPTHNDWMQWCEAGAAIFAKCSRRQYMSIVLSVSGRVLGTGYNGAPAGLPNCTAGGCPRASTDVAHGSGYSNCTAVHAEGNALLHSDRSAREGGTLIINGPPCWECSKLIASSGIAQVVYKEDNEYADWPKCKQLLESVGIRVICITDLDKSRDSGCKMGQRQEQPVDLASGSSDRASMAGSDCLIKSMGPAPLILGDDGTYH